MYERTPAPMIRQRGSLLLVVDHDSTGTDLPDLPSDPQVTTVVVATAEPPETLVLRALLNSALAPGCATVRLVLAGAGAADADGWCPARQLADSLGLPVIAPDGPVIALPGMLFVVGGGWWTFRPGAGPLAEGPRQPATPWQRAVTRPVPAGARLVATPIPAGIWLHGGDEPADADDPVLAVPSDPARVTLVIGRPGSADPDPQALIEYVRELAPAAGDELVLVPYGPGGRYVDDLAARLPGDAVAAVRVDAGLVGAEPDGATVRIVVDDAGLPGWRPPAQRLRYYGGDAPRLLEWRAPMPHLPALDVGTQRLREGWLVEVVRCGLWVRPEHVDDDTVRRMPAHPERLLLLVGTPSGPPAATVWPAVRWLLDALPDNELRYLQPVLPTGTAQPDGFPDAWTLTPDAEVMPVPPGVPDAADGWSDDPGCSGGRDDDPARQPALP
ncbi:hypothetical protein EV385_1735 [Krasilnikovia cinnamomea]|uniref:Uncharacterized protein n=1 Tax=Krasilnikovia cinnamomea TaxID=349313 RepID=A0A4V2G6T8_9ACTN|nr:hypothetical protein [Krasilnikovia cinnamomea]RZU49976.1 hypothetical protein EV385_1735 [Krasilnikovia cinnamomea]